MQLNMDKRTFGLLVLLFLLFAEELVIYSEATRMCKSRSREHKGRRCYNRNCNLICLHEGFVYGRCSPLYRKCYCYKPCSDGGGGGGGEEGGGSNRGDQDPPPTPPSPKSSTLT
ncbi:hypothetical protein Pfo_003402 [Paulownia fortunei]|nr:hypothetical protein Pfo_003402 [Paulownia fortunei]